MSASASGASLNPLSGQTLSGAEILVQVLADEGVDVVFGYSGGAIIGGSIAAYLIGAFGWRAAFAGAAAWPSLGSISSLTGRGWEVGWIGRGAAWKIQRKPAK